MTLDFAGDVLFAALLMACGFVLVACRALWNGGLT